MKAAICGACGDRFDCSHENPRPGTTNWRWCRCGKSVIERDVHGNYTCGGPGFTRLVDVEPEDAL